MSITTIENIATGKVHTGWFNEIQAFTTCGTRFCLSWVLLKQYKVKKGFSVVKLLTCKRCEAIESKFRETE